VSNPDDSPLDANFANPDAQQEYAGAAPPPPQARPRRQKPNAPRPSKLPFGITPVSLLLGLVAVLFAVCVGLVVTLVTGRLGGSDAPTVATASQDGGANQQPRLQVTERATYGDWIYTCVKAPNAAAVRCGISQQLSDVKSKAPLFVWRIVQDGKGGLVADMETRSGVLVNRGIVLTAGSEPPVTVPFEGCMPDGCRAVIALTPDMLGKLPSVEKITATVFPIRGNPVSLALSAKGLGDALAALRQ